MPTPLPDEETYAQAAYEKKVAQTAVSTAEAALRTARATLVTKTQAFETLEAQAAAYYEENNVSP